MLPTNHLAANLRRFRTAQGLSQSALAERAGLSRVGYRDLETGKSTPRPDTLQSLAVALGVAIPHLLAPVRELHHVRFRADRQLAKRENILADVGRWLDGYQEVEQALGSTEDWKLAALAKKLQRSTRSGRSLAEYAAQQVRKELELEGQMIRDMCGLLEDNGVKLLTVPVATDGFFGLSVGPQDGGPAVVINVWERITVERWIFSAAHELAHLLLHPTAYDVERTDENLEEEREADLFASFFIMPQDLFHNEWDEARGLGLVDRVFKLKRIFKVSWQTVVYRVALGLPRAEKDAIWASFRAAYQARFGHEAPTTTEPEALTADAFSGPPISRAADEPARFLGDDFQEDRLCGLVRKAVDTDKISLGRGAEILGLSLLEMRELRNSWID